MADTRIFISFSSQDMDYAEAFAEALGQRLGRDAIFFSPHAIGPGEHYFDRIMEYLNTCNGVILLASAHSVGCSVQQTMRSKHVVREMNEADELNLPVYPVDVDGVLKGKTYNSGIKYLTREYQFIDGRVTPGQRGLSHVIEPLLSALTQQRALPQRSVEERLRHALQEGRIPDAAGLAQSLNLPTLSGDAAVLAVIATLRSRDSLSNLLLDDAAQVADDIRTALEKECSAETRALGLYVAGVMCKEYFQKRVIQCPLGTYPVIKQSAQQLPRLSIANKKLVRDLSKDFRAFEADWFYGS